MTFPTAKRAVYFLFSALLLATAPALAQEAVPEPTGFLVNDYAGLLSRQEVEQLGGKLSQYARRTSTQIVVVTETALNGADPFSRGLAYFEKWGIGGSRENSNGVLLYVAKADRKVRIVTGYGAEGFLPDALSKRIIDQIITPNFREGRYFRGLDRATSAIMELGEGEYINDTPQRGQQKKAKGGIPTLLIIILVVLIIIFLSRRGGGGDDDDDDGGYYRGGRYDMDRRRRRGRRGGGWFFFPFPMGGGYRGGGGGWPGGGGSSDGWGGFGGGGFGGFGGGLTGGGGAGGEW
ncbi:TPM domain-containing protein [Phaeodactylibacter luteus]|nr:TPM domain-containing protein [Phaeodactylibacter luteus]